MVIIFHNITVFTVFFWSNKCSLDEHKRLSNALKKNLSTSNIWIICMLLLFTWLLHHFTVLEPLHLIFSLKGLKRKFKDLVSGHTKGHCTLSPNFSHVFFHFFVFFILSYQNACNGCENAENLTWSEFFLTDESFGGSVQTWLTQREVVLIF